jgi:putative NADPH-quinone reductase
LRSRFRGRPAVQAQIGRLLSAEALMLVFPTWWFDFPLF